MNGLGPWLFPLLLLVGSPVLGVAVRFVVVRHLRKVVEASETRLDDLVLDAAPRYVPAWFFLAGLRGAVELAPSLTDGQILVFHRLVVIGFILSITAAMTRFSTGAIQVYGEKVSSTVGATSLTVNLARLAILSLGVILVLANLGISITPLVTALGVGSLAVALALQDTLSNLFSGIHIVSSRKVDVGDWVKLDSGHEGVVLDISYRTTRLRDAQENVVLIPNARISQGIVVNFSQPTPALDAVVAFPLEATADLDRAEQVAREELERLLREVEGGVPDVPPLLRFRPFREGVLWLEVRLRAVDMPSRALLAHEALKRILRRFRAEGIGVARPVVSPAAN